MGLWDASLRLDEWAGRHPVRFGALFGLFLALFYSLVATLAGRPVYWAAVLVWATFLPTITALGARARHRKKHAAPDESAAGR